MQKQTTYLNFRPFLLHLCCLLLTLPLAAQVSNLSGTLKDAETQEPMAGVQVLLEGTQFSTTTDETGFFDLQVDGIGLFDLIFQKNGQEIGLQPVSLSNETPNQALGAIEINLSGSATSQQDIADPIPTITLGGDDGQGNDEQEYSALLTATNDIFLSTSRYTFGTRRFRLRGYDSENTPFYINGAPINSLENGRVPFSIWSGLNDVTRNGNVVEGNQAVDYSFGGVGGANLVDMRSSSQRRQKRLSASLTNGSYSGRLMGTYSTGLLENGWAFSFSGSRRWAEEGYVDGTFYDAFSYYGAAEKKINEEHSVSLIGFGAHTKRGRNTAAIQEAYDLTGTNYYNPYWGYQEGKKRNSRIALQHQPTIVLNHDWKPNTNTILTTSVAYQFGVNGSTAINWYGARDPRPNYYRKFPSYIERTGSIEAANQVAEVWQNDETARQLQWANFYEANRDNPYTVANANGQAGQTVSGNRAAYILEDRHYDNKQLTFSTNLQTDLSDKSRLMGGLSWRQQTVETYKTLDDLMDADFFVDIDQFAERDLPDMPDAIYPNLLEKNHVVNEGDRFGYDYDIVVQKAEAWVQNTYSLRLADIHVAANVSNTRFWRDSRYQNGIFPDNSLGKSEVENFTNYGLKAGSTFKIDGRNYFMVNGSYRTRAPFARNSFVAPRTRHQTITDLPSEKILSGEVAYFLRSPNVKARASVYFTDFRDQVFTRSFYQDGITTEGEATSGFGNLIMRGIDKRHIGTELALEVKLGPGLTAHAVAGIGQYTYNSRPTADFTLDNTQRPIVVDETIYLKNFYIANGPQSAYNLGLSYRSQKYWSIWFNVSYFDDVYIDPSPLRRTEAAVCLDGSCIDKVDPESELWRSIIDQEKRDGALMMDLSFRGSKKLGDSYLIFNVGLNNILDNKDFTTGGYEQLRFDFEEKDASLFAPRYWYANGFGYYLNVTYRW